MNKCCMQGNLITCLLQIQPDVIEGDLSAVHLHFLHQLCVRRLGRRLRRISNQNPLYWAIRFERIAALFPVTRFSKVTSVYMKEDIFHEIISPSTDDAQICLNFVAVLLTA